MAMTKTKTAMSMKKTATPIVEKKMKKTATPIRRGTATSPGFRGSTDKRMKTKIY